jgi:hypothetical protein
MRSSHCLGRLDTAFDDDRLVADAGFLLPASGSSSRSTSTSGARHAAGATMIRAEIPVTTYNTATPVTARSRCWFAGSGARARAGIDHLMPDLGAAAEARPAAS